jgi:hypothetical protein
MPIKNLLRQIDHIRKKHNATPLPEGKAIINLAFYDTLMKLASALRELHRFMRSKPKIILGQATQAEMDAHREAMEFIPIYVDSGFVYLRRLSDRLAESMVLVFFEHWQSAPRELQGFDRWDANDIARLKPLCDPASLAKVLFENRAWLSLLRRDQEAGGFRDALEHRPTRIIPTAQWTGDGPLEHHIYLDTPASDVDTQRDLIPVLRRAIDGFCDLATGLCSVIQWDKGYDSMGWDWLPIWGRVEDIIGFWPEV